MFVAAWVNSPGHFKNIITPAYTHTGIGVWLDLKRYTIYATQAFSISQQGSATTRATPYSPQSLQKRQRKRGIDYKEDRNYKLTYNDSACANCSFDWSGSKVTSEKGDVYFSTFYGSEELIEHLRNKGNGFATETVNYSSFSTNNNDWHLMPSRRNQQQIKNGRLTLPYYRKSIIRQIMRQAPFKT